MKIHALILALALCLGSVAHAAFRITINPMGVISVQSKTGAGALNVGTALKWTKNSKGGSAEVDVPAAGGRVDAVVYDSATSESTPSRALLVGSGLAQIRAGGTISEGDALKTDAQGRWITASASDKNVYFIALVDATVGDLFVARSMAGRERDDIARTLTPITGTGASQNIPHGLGAVPTACRAFIAELPIGLTFVVAAGITAGTHDATNAKFTAVAGLKYHVECWL